MPNLTTTIQLIKRASTVLVFLFLVSLLLVAIFFRYQKKAPQEAPPVPISSPIINQNPNQKQPALLNLSQLETATIPENLPAFIAQKYTITDIAAQTLAKGFGITNNPSFVEEETLDGKQYNWDEGNLSLTVSQTSLLFKNKTKITGVKLSLKELKEKAAFFVQKVPLADNLAIDDQKTKYLTITDKDRLKSASSFENAHLVEFSYQKNLSGLPLLTNQPDSPYTSIDIAKDGQVVYLSSRFFEKFTQLDSYPIKSASEAVDQIKNGQGKIVLTQILDENGQALELFRNQPININSALINKLSLAYFLPDNPQETIQPIFVAEGNFQRENEKGRVLIYLAAIKSLIQP